MLCLHSALPVPSMWLPIAWHSSFLELQCFIIFTHNNWPIRLGVWVVKLVRKKGVDTEWSQTWHLKIHSVAETKVKGKMNKATLLSWRGIWERRSPGVLGREGVEVLVSEGVTWWCMRYGIMQVRHHYEEPSKPEILNVKFFLKKKYFILCIVVAVGKLGNEEVNLKSVLWGTSCRSWTEMKRL